MPLYVVGSEPPADIKKLASEQVIVTGWVRDLTPFYETARLFIAPLRWGAGMKGKIGESMAHGLPAVVTSVGAEGMGLEDGKQVLIADDPEDFARKVVEVYMNAELWTRLSRASLDHVANNYSTDVVREKVRAMLSAHRLLPKQHGKLPDNGISPITPLSPEFR